MSRPAKHRPAPPAHALRRKTEDCNQTDDTGRFRIADARDGLTMLPPAGAAEDVLSLEAIGGTLESAGDDHGETPVARSEGPVSGIFKSGQQRPELETEDPRLADSINSSRPYYRGDESRSERAQLQIDDFSLSLDNPFLASSLVPPPRRPAPMGKLVGLVAATALTAATAWFVARVTFQPTPDDLRLQAEPTFSQRAPAVISPAARSVTAPAAAAVVSAPTTLKVGPKPLAAVVAQVAATGISKGPATATAVITAPTLRPSATTAPVPAVSAGLAESARIDSSPQGTHEKVASASQARELSDEAREPAPVAAPAREIPPPTAQAETEPSASEPTIAEAAASSEGEANGALPEAPTREDVMAGFAQVQADLVACAAGKHGLTEIDATILNTGRVARALVEGVFKGTPEGSCIARAVRAAHFPRFSQPSLRVSYPVSL